MYGEDLGDDGMTEECFTIFQKEITKYQIALRNSSRNGEGDLFEFLNLCDSMESAEVIENVMSEMWKAHEDLNMPKRLDDAIVDLRRGLEIGNNEKALLSYLDIVQDDPSYAEAWEMLSTCHFINGDMQSSLDSANKALQLIPSHFQALYSLGSVHFRTRRFNLAVASFRRCLHLNPWSRASTALAACTRELSSHETLCELEDNSRKMEEQGSSERGNAVEHVL
jgi:tetratricopeptide (TPR) repeat protein